MVWTYGDAVGICILEPMEQVQLRKLTLRMFFGVGTLRTFQGDSGEADFLCTYTLCAQ